MKSIVVSKFGGTSMQDARAMLRSRDIALDRKSSVVVVSATSGTTNQLLELGRLAQAGNQERATELVSEIRKRHLQIARDLGFGAGELLEPLLLELESISKGIFLLGDFSPRASDALVSLGERLASVLFAEAMKQKTPTHWGDVRQILKTDGDFGKARPLISEVEKLCRNHWLPLIQEKVIVTQGFIGQTEDGLTTTLGRGGSDYSAALLAEALSAQTLEIWTDVAGIATTDPRIVKEARPLKEISFKEASELATFGAKILHPSTLAPAIRKNIPVFVGSSFAAEEQGTWIRKTSESAPLLRALALRKNQILVTVTTPDMLNAYGFLYRIFKVFNDHKVSVDAITTSEISVALTLDGNSELPSRLIQELNEFAEVQVEKDLCLVSLIGNKINHTAGLGQKIFESIRDINVRMICLGASVHNFCFLVANDRGTEVIQRLHRQFELDRS